MRRGRWAGRSPGVGGKVGGQVHLASDTGANWPGEMGPGPSYRPALPACHGVVSTQHVGESAWTDSIGCSLSLSCPTCTPSLLLLPTDPSSESSPGGFQPAASNLLCTKEGDRSSLFQFVLGGTMRGCAGSCPWPVGCRGLGGPGVAAVVGQLSSVAHALADC